MQCVGTMLTSPSSMHHAHSTSPLTTHLSSHYPLPRAPTTAPLTTLLPTLRPPLLPLLLHTSLLTTPALHTPHLLRRPCLLPAATPHTSSTSYADPHFATPPTLQPHPPCTTTPLLRDYLLTYSTYRVCNPLCTWTNPQESLNLIPPFHPTPNSGRSPLT